MNGILEFVDTSDMTVMTTPQEHFMCTDVEWDPTGRYVATAVSYWGHKVAIIYNNHSLCVIYIYFFTK